jgi:hypothetical protein
MFGIRRDKEDIRGAGRASGVPAAGGSGGILGIGEGLKALGEDFLLDGEDTVLQHY